MSKQLCKISLCIVYQTKLTYVMTQAAKLSKKATVSKHIQTAIMTTKTTHSTHNYHYHHHNLVQIPLRETIRYEHKDWDCQG